MAFVVQGESVVEDANSYVSLSEASTYHTDRGNTAWAAAASDAIRQAALIRATAYLDAVYGLKAPGKRISFLQTLVWPRVYAWDRDGFPLIGVPAALKQATLEAALLALSSDLLPPSERIGQVILEKVGNVERRYSGGSSVTTYQLIDRLMQPLLRTSARVTR